MESKSLTKLIIFELWKSKSELSHVNHIVLEVQNIGPIQTPIQRLSQT